MISPRQFSRTLWSKDKVRGLRQRLEVQGQRLVIGTRELKIFLKDNNMDYEVLALALRVRTLSGFKYRC